MRKAASKTTPCCSKVGIKRGPWTAEEDEILTSFIQTEGNSAWRTLPKRAGLLRCGKSCRLRWMNYLRPHLNRGPISDDEEDLILRLHRLLGNRWSLIAGRIPGRTDNEIKNYWNTHLSKKLISQGLDPRTHKPLEIYNPNPKPHNKEEVIFVRTSDPMPNPNPNTASPSVIINQDGVGASEGMIMEGYNEDMYFSSFLDSLIMNEECVFHQPDDQQLVSSFNNNQLMIQEQMVYESNNSHQGVIWGSNHEVSPLITSGLYDSQRVQGSRNLDPADMKRQ